jgi:hypothetical protein
MLSIGLSHLVYTGFSYFYGSLFIISNRFGENSFLRKFSGLTKNIFLKLWLNKSQCLAFRKSFGLPHFRMIFFPNFLFDFQNFLQIVTSF